MLKLNDTHHNSPPGIFLWYSAAIIVMATLLACSCVSNVYVVATAASSGSVQHTGGAHSSRGMMMLPGRSISELDSAADAGCTAEPGCATSHHDV